MEIRLLGTGNNELVKPRSPDKFRHDISELEELSSSHIQHNNYSTMWSLHFFKHWREAAGITRREFTLNIYPPKHKRIVLICNGNKSVSTHMNVHTYIAILLNVTFNLLKEYTLKRSSYTQEGSHAAACLLRNKWNHTLQLISTIS